MEPQPKRKRERDVYKHLWLPPDTHERLKRLAEIRRQTMVVVIDTLVTAQLEILEKK